MHKHYVKAMLLVTGWILMFCSLTMVVYNASGSPLAAAFVILAVCMFVITMAISSKE
jgi:hypothetical protein